MLDEGTQETSAEPGAPTLDGDPMPLAAEIKHSKIIGLVTLTHEPFQPVRLYYSIPDRDVVAARLRMLECWVEAPEGQCWRWLFQGEAALLRFGGGYEDVPAERGPIILGRIRFPTRSAMMLQTNSVARAIGAAQFFAS
jgi:hypothetical protein